MRELLGLLVITLMLVTPFHGAFANPEAEQAARPVAEEFLKLVDQGRYAQSWDNTSSLVKETVTREHWSGSIAGARKAFGALISRKFAIMKYATELPGAPDGEYVVVQYQSSFENKKSALETVTPQRDKDGVWRISGYYIR